MKSPLNIISVIFVMASGGTLALSPSTKFLKGLNGLNGMPPLEPAPTPVINGGGDHHHQGSSVLVDKNLDDIFEQNRLWKADREATDPDYFKRLGAGHNPKYMWIGCADARVPANEIMGKDAGTVFVLRNVANMVISTDFNVMSALQFAVAVLKVDHIIVCGHYDCGGVRASLQNLDHVPPLENWLRNIRDVYRLHREELDGITDPEARHRRLVELNVVEQCINLFKTGVVQRRRVETYKSGQEYTTPRIHACVFDPKVGLLQKLEVDFHEYIDELHGIYDLYNVDDEYE
eukprot:CAMPEP_0194028742 /NCGR_PEP_ID=MMETSP0009_2-20130614/2646_1 /TAXON_ID=210454 /ORGANISM="Grammatophora oceanica, Strain CCMP 410" /LENGTH=289 /DNA_ID=CAMNT_0038668223 /DNA_START=151 /DNA_END=1020 /DNA_ORIENTATION=+